MLFIIRYLNVLLLCQLPNIQREEGKNIDRGYFYQAAVDYDSWYKMELGKVVDQVERTMVEKMFKTC